MNRILLVAGFGVFLLSCMTLNDSGISGQTNSTRIDTAAFVGRHNFYRSQLGVPSIHWNDSLATYAQNWANHLAATCDIEHSDGPYGENIYWSSAPRDEQRVVDKWAEEQQYFDHQNRTYIAGKSHASGHYSQVIWAKSTELGAGVANCKNGAQIWVCVYNPPGNRVGEKAY